jgi:hypothetical protein
MSGHLAAALLADYWAAALAGAEQERVELHLLECDECAASLREVIALADGVRRLAREGALRVVLNDAFLERATHEGLRIREYAPPAGGGVQCTVTANDDLVMARLPADLRGARRVDLAMCAPDGQEMMRLRDVPFQAAGKDILFNEPIAQLRTLTHQVLLVKMYAVEENSERLLGQYTFNHYAS